MRKWSGCLLISGLALILLVSYTFIGKSEPSTNQTAYDFFNPHSDKDEGPDPVAKASDEHPEAQNTNQPPTARLKTLRIKPKFTKFEGLNELYVFPKNTMKAHDSALLAWSKMKFLFPRSDSLPETGQGIKEAAIMWKHLVSMIENGNDDNASVVNKACPRFVTASKNTRFLEIPCGLVEDSSVTVIGIPDLHSGGFQIELVGSRAEELNCPIVLHYNVVLPGENLTKEPVMIQNTWTQESGWGKEEKCPDRDTHDLLNVDGLVKCNTQIILRTTDESPTTNHTSYRNSSNASVSSTQESSTFHLVDGNPFTATLWAGNEGFHMTVNGRHETSFAYRERLEPWLVNRVNVSGGLRIVSVLAKGLPIDEDADFIANAQELKRATSIYTNKRIRLFIGVFSSGNNFERRMAIRRTWMQYGAIRSGDVAVCFFIGLHKNKDVNLKVWKEAEAYGDIQLMPFVDYYGLLTYKTIAICILGTKILHAEYIMKMDDDAFVRVDEILSSLEGKASNRFLYGRISSESAPNRDNDNKWFISNEEWPHSSYPPWAHGPGYIISQDIARFIIRGHKDRDLTLFKLEDVAVGIWVEQYGRRGQKIEYFNDDRFYNAGCESGYMLAHYQNPRLMLCLWEKLQKEHKPECCE